MEMEDSPYFEDQEQLDETFDTTEEASKIVIGPKPAKNKQAAHKSGGALSASKCCYICLEDSTKSLALIGKKLIKTLRGFQLFIFENEVTPAYLCDQCRTDLTNSCELLNRVRDARKFWSKFSEKLGCPTEPKRMRRSGVVPQEEELKVYKPKAVAISKFYRCQMCLEKYTNQIALSIHQWDVHIKNKDQPELCPECNRQFLDSDQCRRHYQRVHYDAQFVCELCGKSGMTKPQMKFHLKAYHNTTLKASGLAKDCTPPTHVLIATPANAKAKNEIEDSLMESVEYLDEVDQLDTAFEPSSAADNNDESENEEPAPPKKVKSSVKLSLAGLPPPIITPNGFDSKSDRNCPDCGAWFSANDESKYYLHYWIDHARLEDHPQVCRECRKEFSAEDLCRRHFFTNHFEQNYTCNLCYKTDMTAVQYKFHIKYCAKKHQTLLQIGEQDQLQVEVKCAYCEDTFPENDKVRLFNHVWKFHMLNTGSPTICSMCQKDCFTVNNCRAHFYNIHYDNNHICRICDKGGFNKVELKVHRQAVHRETVEKIKQRRQGNASIPTQDCDFCGESFRTSTDEWTKHVWITHARNNDAPDRCEECNKTYPNEFFAKKHYFGHHYRKVEICDECGKGNMTRRELVNHMKNHSLTKGKKQIQCQLCTRILNSDESYKRHLVFHQNQKMDRTHQCTLCGLYYPTQQSLRLHTRSVHLKEVTHPCRYCDHGFYTHSSRNKHEIAIHTKLYPFKCSFCGTETAQISQLRRHIETQHLKVPVTKDEIDTKYIIRQHGSEESKIYKKKMAQMQMRESMEAQPQYVEQQYQEEFGE